MPACVPEKAATSRRSGSPRAQAANFTASRMPASWYTRFELPSGMAKIQSLGTFGVFFPGRLVAHLYDEHGTELETLAVANVDPR